MDITIIPMTLMTLVQEAVEVVGSAVGTGEVGAGLGGLSVIGVLYKIISDILKDRKVRPTAQRLVNGHGEGRSNPGPVVEGTTIQMILTTLDRHDKEFVANRKLMGEMKTSLTRVEEQIKLRRKEDRP